MYRHCRRHVKGFTEILINDILSPSLGVTSGVTPSQKVKQDFPLVKPCWLFKSHPCPPCALAKLPGGTVPSSSQAQRGGWSVNSSQDPPCYLFKDTYSVPLFPVTWDFTWPVLSSGLVPWIIILTPLLNQLLALQTCNLIQGQISAGVAFKAMEIRHVRAFHRSSKSIQLSWENIPLNPFLILQKRNEPYAHCEQIFHHLLSPDHSI